jgi:MoxR-like ATPase
LAPELGSIEETTRRLSACDYVADEALSTSLFLSIKMTRPLFLEGEPGVGKTELARVLSSVFQTELIRLQCYEGLDLNQAVYEWNYPRQLLTLQAPSNARAGEAEPDIFTERFLIKRPLLDAIDARHAKAPVLLIDELDRADEEFESFLLELLSDFQITIPEIGTLRAKHRPLVVLTSNRTREIHDALKRRCIYHWIDYPTPAKEAEIVGRKVPDLNDRLVRQIVSFAQGLRAHDLQKLPGVAETIDWAEALGHLGKSGLDEETVRATLGILLKNQDDIETARDGLAAKLLAQSSALGG